MIFAHRNEAGQYLATRLQDYADPSEVLVLALPRGGVPVGFEIAKALHTPLDVFLVRKLGLPGHGELAMGVVATGGVRVLNKDLIRMLSVSRTLLESVTEIEQRELVRRERLYRAGRPSLSVRGHTVILVDDGTSTGFTVRAAVTALRQQRPRQIIVAVPISTPETCAAYSDEADETICAVTPDDFIAPVKWYDDFDQVTDDDVQRYLRHANKPQMAFAGHE